MRIGRASLLLAACAVLLIMLIYRRRHTASPALRDQAGVALIGAAVALFPGILWLGTTILALGALELWYAI